MIDIPIAVAAAICFALTYLCGYLTGRRHGEQSAVDRARKQAETIARLHADVRQRRRDIAARAIKKLEDAKKEIAK